MVTIRLLGPPAIERDGRPVRPPRGRKAWALLAYLLLAERPPSRRQLAELLFADADDPLGALRWTLAELRRALGAPDVLHRRPGRPPLGAGVTVDVQLLAATTPTRPAAGPRRRAARRRRAAVLPGVRVVAAGGAAPGRPATVEARLRQAAVALLAAGRAADAVAVRAAGGRPQPARARATTNCWSAASRWPATGRRRCGRWRSCEDLLRRELGVEASPALARRGRSIGPGVRDGAAARAAARRRSASSRRAGRRSWPAPSTPASSACAGPSPRRPRCGDDALRGRALVALGGALVHAVRGRDEEGASSCTRRSRSPTRPATGRPR